MPQPVYREITSTREHEFLERGFRSRHFFAHDLFYLPKCAPDAFKLGTRMCGCEQPERHWQILLYAQPREIRDLPNELFFDDEVLWHGQHLGRPGQIGWAGLIVEDGQIFSVGQQSDLVQRIGRRRSYKTQVENRFKGWPRLLLHSMLAFAAERGIRWINTPTAALAMAHTDPKREVGPELFERVYNRPVESYAARERDGWWVIDVRANLGRVVVPERSGLNCDDARTVCVCHDVEGGLGHVGVDDRLRTQADHWVGDRLDRMLAVEQAHATRATYNVVGSILPDLRGEIERRGHCLAFHSYDHSSSTAGAAQLSLCREVDYRLKGYRAPKSLIGDLGETDLAFHNFEWLASSARSLGNDSPSVRNRVVRVPIATDDYPLYRGAMGYEEWERSLLAMVRSQPFTAVGLHDCYAPFWLDRYEQLLDRLSQEARLCTLDEVSARTLIGQAA